MNAELLREKIPFLMEWIKRTASAHDTQAVASLALPRLGLYYSNKLLSAAKFIPIASVPFPPLASMGLKGFEDFERMNPDGITYLSTYFIRRGLEDCESLHFHELVHVVQWRILGAERFLMAYALGFLLGGGYRENPLEEMAYRLEGRFTDGGPAFDVQTIVEQELVGVVRILGERASSLSGWAQVASWHRPASNPGVREQIRRPALERVRNAVEDADRKLSLNAQIAHPTDTVAPPVISWP